MNYLTLLMLYIVNLQLADITMNCSPSDFPFIFSHPAKSDIGAFNWTAGTPTEQPGSCRHYTRRGDSKNNSVQITIVTRSKSFERREVTCIGYGVEGGSFKVPVKVVQWLSFGLSPTLSIWLAGWIIEA